MTDASITAAALERIEAAKQKYAVALRRLDDLRRNASRAAPAECQSWLDEATRHVKEAFAEWVMLVEHETGHKLTSLSLPTAAD